VAKKTSDSADDRALMALFRAIVARDRKAASRLLSRSPELAKQAAAVGASRQEARAYFFESISHYAYAGDTPLHMAAAAHEPGIAGDLIAKGAAVRARNRRGAEPLHYAADGHPGSPRWNPEAQSAVIRLLIKAGADPNAINKDGVAPIHRAVRTRSAAAVRALLESEADSRLKNKSGNTPLHLAVQNTGRRGSGCSTARLEQREIIRLLVKHGARATDKNSAGKTVRECFAGEWIGAVISEG